MANRGMLPKFRPAALGGREAAARPSIRPVRPTAPPPPPSPPRRVSSGVRHPAPHGPAIESNDGEVSTASFQDPPTMAAARQRIHELARELPSQYDGAPRFFDDETQARQVDGDLIMASRPQARPDQFDVPYDALPSLEVARPFDEYEEQFAERDPETQLRGARYSDEHRRPSEPPPAKIRAKGYAAPSEDSGPRQRPRKNATPVPQYDAAAYEANYPGIRRDEDSFADRHESFGPRRPEHESYRSSPRREEPSSSYQPPARNDAAVDAIPQAPAVPREMQVPAGFVMGVQPIRTPGSVAAAMPHYTDTQAPEAFPAPAPYPQAPSRTPMMGVPYGQPVPPVQSTAPRGVHASAQYMAIHAGTSGQFAPPVGHQLQTTDVGEARQGSKVGRFAWFVFGAAFGIFFAFCATGFVPRLGKKEEIAFPPPAQLPAQEQAPVAVAPPQPVPVQVPTQPVVAVAQLPVVASQPEPQPVVQQPVVAAAPPAFAPTPAPQPIVAPQPVVPAQPAPAPQPVAAAAQPQPAAAPAPRGQRGAAVARRNAPPPSSAPRALPNSGSVDSDDAPSAPASRASASKESKGGPDVGGISDLLSAGLAP